MPRIAKNITDVRIGTRIRSLRLTRGISQTDLARFMGVTFQQVQKYEKGKSRIAASLLFQLAEEYGVPVDYFVAKPLSKASSKRGNGLSDQDAEMAFAFAQTHEGFALMRAFAQLERSTGKALIAFAQHLAACQPRK